MNTGVRSLEGKRQKKEEKAGEKSMKKRGEREKVKNE